MTKFNKLMILCYKSYVTFFSCLPPHRAHRPSPRRDTPPLSSGPSSTMRKRKFPENLNDSDHFESCLYYLKWRSHQPKEENSFYIFYFFFCLLVCFQEDNWFEKEKETPISIRLWLSVRKEVLFQIEPTNEENRFSSCVFDCVSLWNFKLDTRRSGKLRWSYQHAGTQWEEEKRLISCFQCFGNCCIYFPATVCHS